MSLHCINCKHYRDGHCRYRNIDVDDNDSCHYFELPKEIPLPPRGERRLAAVAAKKHVTLFVKSKRGSTDPLLKELRKNLRLSPGYRLVRSRATPGSSLYGAVHIKEARSGQIIRTLYPEDIRRIMGAF